MTKNSALAETTGRRKNSFLAGMSFHPNRALLGTQHEAEPEAIATPVGLEVTPVCRAATTMTEAPAAATHYTLRSYWRSLRVHNGVLWVLAVPILAPLVEVAVHVIQAERIRAKAAYRSSLPTKEVSLAGEKLKANMEQSLRSGTAGVFPLRFSRGAVITILSFQNFPDEFLTILTGHALNQKVFLAPEVARIVPQDGLPLLLRDRVNAEVEALGKRDLVRNFIVHPVRFLLRTSHCERPWRYPHELHAEAVRDAAAECWLRCRRLRGIAASSCHSTDLAGSTNIRLTIHPLRSI